MTSRPLAILGTIIIVIAVIAAAGYLIHGQNSVAQTASSAATATETSTASAATTTTATATVVQTTSPNFYESTSTPDSADAATTSADDIGFQSLDIPFPASSTVDTSSWQIYTDSQGRYSIEYPSNLEVSVTSGVPTFAFPKASYFSWPLLDDAKVTIASELTCPPIVNGATSQGPVQLSLNGYDFARTVGTDVGAGQRYLEIAYDTQGNGVCYHIDFLDHGTDGAAFYVDDASLVSTYDAEHDADLSSAISAMNGMVGTFHILVPTQ